MHCYATIFCYLSNYHRLRPYSSRSELSFGTPATAAMSFGCRSRTSCCSPNSRGSSLKRSVPPVLEHKQSKTDWLITPAIYRLTGWTTTRTWITQWTLPRTRLSRQGRIPGQGLGPGRGPSGAGILSRDHAQGSSLLLHRSPSMYLALRRTVKTQLKRSIRCDSVG